MPRIFWIGKDSLVPEELLDKLNRTPIEKYRGTATSGRLPSGEKFVSIPYDREGKQSHISLGHEIAHLELGHQDYTLEDLDQVRVEEEFIPGHRRNLKIRREWEVVGLQIYQLMAGGEWTSEAKRQIVDGMSSYLHSYWLAKQEVEQLVRKIRKDLRHRGFEI